MSILVLKTLFKNNIGIPAANLIEATNGLEAYQKATIINFDLILMDLNMPVMSGLEATKKIRAFFNQSNVYMSEGYDSSGSEQS